MENQINAIWPVKKNGQWVFTDSRVGLVDEPFVAGADVLIDVMVMHIPDAKDGFVLLFSAKPFPDADHMFERGDEEMGGFWYRHQQSTLAGWLCPAIFEYFDTAPERIYVKCKPMGEK